MMDVLTLDSHRLREEEEAKLLYEKITKLIAKHAITPAMGSSLVNDSTFAHDVSTNLIRAAQVLFAAAAEDQSEAARDVMLDKNDLDRIEEQSA